MPLPCPPPPLSLHGGGAVCAAGLRAALPPSSSSSSSSSSSAAARGCGRGVPPPNTAVRWGPGFGGGGRGVRRNEWGGCAPPAAGIPHCRGRGNRVTAPFSGVGLKGGTTGPPLIAGIPIAAGITGKPPRSDCKMDALRATTGEPPHHTPPRCRAAVPPPPH